MDGSGPASPFGHPSHPARLPAPSMMGLSTPTHQSSVPVPTGSSPAFHRPQQSVSSVIGVRAKRSSSHLSWASRTASTSRASDEDSKTSVRVVVRVRPPPLPTDPDSDLIPHRFQSAVVQVQSSAAVAVDLVSHSANQTSTPASSAAGRKLFVFDRVFEPSVDQEGIWDYLSESVNHFVDGYNVSLLAYGQSGSGKSYTMGTTGKAEQENSERMGIVPRAAHALFERLGSLSGPVPPAAVGRTSGQALRTPKRYSIAAPPSFQASPSRNMGNEQGWQLYATYVEIYNEQLRDLLLPDSPANLASRPTISIREDTKGRIFLTGLRQVAIHSIEDLLEILNSGSSIRQTDSTAVNEKSSRSHAIFSLTLIQKKSVSSVANPIPEKRFSVPADANSVLGTASGNTDNGFVTATVDSKLHFVDLAGSERLKNTGAQGERAREGISINAGLATLGKVISQLSKQSSAHVSYRDSKLTRILQDSLGGNAITYMIACVNPVEFHVSETVNTLQYAQRARAIQSKPQIQHVVDDRDKQAAIDRLRAEVSFLRDQIRMSDRPNGARSLGRRLNDLVRASAEAKPEFGSHYNRDRETELRNQVLALQENYSALSQRHAKLISDLAKAREAGEAAEMFSTATSAASSAQMDRLKQPNSSEAVEKVVLEYEKTIQSLESSLSTTRASLSASEAVLLERESKIAYLETASEKLQARIQKATDREANDERYLHELEARVEGAATHEEKNGAVVEALKCELARARESEASCEDYISTLEERLAEAEQDCNMMQREINRLENILERERSIGKLDSLLHELDRGASGSVSPTDHLGTITDEDMSGTSSPSPFPALVNGPLLTEEDEDVDDMEAIVQDADPVTVDGLGSNLHRLSTSPRKKKGHTPSLSRHSCKPSIDDVVNAELENLYDEQDDDFVVIHGMTLREQKQYYRQNLAEMTKKLSEAIGRVAELEELRVRPGRSAVAVSDAGSPSTKLPEPADAALSLSSELQLLRRDESTSTVGEESGGCVNGAKPTLHDTDPDVSSTLEAMMRVQKRHSWQRRSLNRLSVETQSDVGDGRPSPRRSASPEEKPVGLVTLASTTVKTHFPPISTPTSLSRRPNLPVVDELAGADAEDEEDEAEPKDEDGNVDTAIVLARLRERYGRLKLQHETTVQQIDNLKTDLHRAQMSGSGSGTVPLAASSSSGFGSPPGAVIRRMSSQTLSSTDRPQHIMHQLQMRLETDFKLDRSVLTVVEVELQKVMIDLQMRTDRLAGMEADLIALKQQISQKSTIITGLTRERSSLQATASSPLDKSLLSILQEEIVAKEKQMNAQASTVSALQDEINSLKACLSLQTGKEETKVDSSAALDSLRQEHEIAIADLETAHKRDLEQLDQRHSTTATLLDRELDAHKGLVTNLEKQLAEHRAIVDKHDASMAALQKSHQTQVAEIEARFTEAEQGQQQVKAEFEKSRVRIASLVATLSTSLGREGKDEGDVDALVADLVASRTSLQTRLNDLTKSSDDCMAELERVRKQEKVNAQLVEALEEQLTTHYNRQVHSDSAALEEDLAEARMRIAELESRVGDATAASGDSAQPTTSDILAPIDQDEQDSAAELAKQATVIEDQESRLRTLEKHLFAEKQLTATLEEALTDLETSSTRLRTEMDSWRRKCLALEEELATMRQERNESRLSVQQLEEEQRFARARIEREKANLEARMQQLAEGKTGRRKMGGLNCF